MPTISIPIELFDKLLDYAQTRKLQIANKRGMRDAQRALRQVIDQAENLRDEWTEATRDEYQEAPRPRMSEAEFDAKYARIVELYGDPDNDEEALAKREQAIAAFLLKWGITREEFDAKDNE
jgi:hypothetical protein